MAPQTRRSFLGSSAATAATASGPWTDLRFLLPLSAVTASDTTIDPDRVQFGPELAPLIRLIKTTPREKCVSVFIQELRAGLSYQDFLSALFLASLDAGDPHQVAQIYSAHRVSSEARTEERLLPLFWALDRVKSGYEQKDGERPSRGHTGELPKADRAAGVLDGAMTHCDPDAAERAIVALARSEGSRQAMARLLAYGARNVSGTLGHHPIFVANGWRTLDAMGWQHAEPVLRYITRLLSHHKPDRTFAPNLERVDKIVPGLPTDWASNEHSHEATLDLYKLLRAGSADETCDLICSQLCSGKVKAGTVWDAIHLVAADLVFRYKIGGVRIGGSLIHGVTCTNALRYGFDCAHEDRVRLLMLLQGAAALADAFIAPALTDRLLRDMNLLDLGNENNKRAISAADIFSMLPFKANKYEEREPNERQASDEACRLTFAVLSDSKQVKTFQQTARTFLCVKASLDPHDFKYPAAAFEDAARVHPQWRSYLLAASVHALHGSKSHDTPVLVEAREARL
jgi:hypothetical protein